MTNREGSNRTTDYDAVTRIAEALRERTGIAWEYACLQAEREFARMRSFSPYSPENDHTYCLEAGRCHAVDCPAR